MNSELLSDMLQNEGCVVRRAENRRVALERLDESTPALILLDLMNPVMSTGDKQSRWPSRSLPTSSPSSCAVMATMGIDRHLSFLRISRTNSKPST